MRSVALVCLSTLVLVPSPATADCGAPPPRTHAALMYDWTVHRQTMVQLRMALERCASGKWDQCVSRAFDSTTTQRVRAAARALAQLQSKISRSRMGVSNQCSFGDTTAGGLDDLRTWCWSGKQTCFDMIAQFEPKMDVADRTEKCVDSYNEDGAYQEAYQKWQERCGGDRKREEQRTTNQAQQQELERKREALRQQRAALEQQKREAPSGRRAATPSTDWNPSNPAAEDAQRQVDEWGRREQEKIDREYEEKREKRRQERLEREEAKLAERERELEEAERAAASRAREEPARAAVVPTAPIEQRPVAAVVAQRPPPPPPTTTTTTPWVSDDLWLLVPGNGLHDARLGETTPKQISQRWGAACRKPVQRGALTVIECPPHKIDSPPRIRERPPTQFTFKKGVLVSLISADPSAPYHGIAYARVGHPSWAVQEPIMWDVPDKKKGNEVLLEYGGVVFHIQKGFLAAIEIVPFGDHTSPNVKPDKPAPANPDDPNELIPGIGIAGMVIGRNTRADVLRRFPSCRDERPVVVCADVNLPQEFRFGAGDVLESVYTALPHIQHLPGKAPPDAVPGVLSGVLGNKFWRIPLGAEELYLFDSGVKAQVRGGKTFAITIVAPGLLTPGR